MIKFLDFLCGFTLIVSIYICGTKPKLGWFIYIFNAFIYTFLMFYKGLLFMGITGIVLGIIGIRNFWRNRK